MLVGSSNVAARKRLVVIEVAGVIVLITLVFVPSQLGADLAPGPFVLGLEGAPRAMLLLAAQDADLHAAHHLGVLATAEVEIVSLLAEGLSVLLVGGVANEESFGSAPASAGAGSWAEGTVFHR